MRDIILSEIKRLAENNGGKAPGSIMFSAATGIGETKWRGVYWARWSDALADAGYSANEWNQRLDSDAILKRLAELALDKGRVPPKAELQMLRKTDRSIPDPNTLLRHFGSRPGMIEALRAYCSRHDRFEAVLKVLPDTQPKPAPASSAVKEGWVYLLKSGQHYKIGRSDQVEARVKKISIALPEATTLVHAIKTDDPPGIEAYWHRRFGDRRANGEWFKLSAADVAAFTRRRYQ